LEEVFVIDIPGKVKVLRYRMEEVLAFRRPVEVAEEWGVDYFSKHVKEEYPFWHIYAMVYDELADYYFVILTERPIPVLSTVEYDEEGTPFIKETVMQ
jgi:hypothetical protein